MRCLLLFWACSVLSLAAHNVRDYGAKGDGLAKDTDAIQKALNAAERAGGGEVLIPAGRFVSGTLHLRSNVTLRLENGAVLLASPDEADFDVYEKLPFESVSDKETTYFHYALLAADGVENVAIVGEGAVDGNRTKRGGPKTIALKLSKHVAIRGITVRNSPNYSISFWGCDYVEVHGVTILNGYADGIDPDASRYVRISDCYIDAHDDAICPKASPSMGMDAIRNTEHLTVTNCILRTDASNFKFGTESSGNFRNVTVSNLTMLPRENGRSPVSGISIESVDGAKIEGVSISNITMEGVRVPIFVRLGNRGRGLSPARPGSIQDVIISNVIATGASLASSITGVPGFRPERIRISNVQVTTAGGEKAPLNFVLPEYESKYPEGTMFGMLPAFGFYLRHAGDVSLNGVFLRTATGDGRPAIIADDIRELHLEGASKNLTKRVLP